MFQCVRRTSESSYLLRISNFVPRPPSASFFFGRVFTITPCRGPCLERSFMWVPSVSLLSASFHPQVYYEQKTFCFLTFPPKKSVGQEVQVCCAREAGSSNSNKNVGAAAKHCRRSGLIRGSTLDVTNCIFTDCQFVKVANILLLRYKHSHLKKKSTRDFELKHERVTETTVRPLHDARC